MTVGLPIKLAMDLEELSMKLKVSRNSLLREGVEIVLRKYGSP